LFFGRYYHAIDSKGRVSVPAQFRDKLLHERMLMLAPYKVFGEHCIDVYPWGEWEKLLGQFAQRPRFSLEVQRFEMRFLSRSHQCEIDAAGRILVPPVLREYAGLKKDVVFLGVNLRFRMMDGDRLTRVEGEIESEDAVDSAMFGDLGL